MANYKISQLPAYDQPVAADDLLAAVDTSFGTTKKLTAAQLFNDAGLTGLTTADTIDFNAGGLGGELSWNNQDKTIDLATGSDGVVIQVGQEVVLLCRNKSGEVLVDGDVVKITGATGGTPNIAKAIASTVDEAHKTIGVCTQTIPNNSTGFITELGKVRGLSFPSGSFDEGDLLYLSSTLAGAMTKTKPPIEVELGQVIRTGNNNGEFAVSINNEASLYELEQELLQQVPHNTDYVVICNDGDNIQDKYDEAALLTGNTKTLIVMDGTYGNVEFTDANFFPAVNIIGIGNPTLGSIIDNTTFLSTTATYKNFTCNSVFLNIAEGNIENITTTSSFYCLSSYIVMLRQLKI